MTEHYPVLTCINFKLTNINHTHALQRHVYLALTNCCTHLALRINESLQQFPVYVWQANRPRFNVCYRDPVINPIPDLDPLLTSYHPRSPTLSTATSIAILPANSRSPKSTTTQQQQSFRRTCSEPSPTAASCIVHRRPKRTTHFFLCLQTTTPHHTLHSLPSDHIQHNHPPPRHKNNVTTKTTKERKKKSYPPPFLQPSSLHILHLQKRSPLAHRKGNHLISTLNAARAKNSNITHIYTQTHTHTHAKCTETEIATHISLFTLQPRNKPDKQRKNETRPCIIISILSLRTPKFQPTSGKP